MKFELKEISKNIQKNINDSLAISTFNTIINRLYDVNNNVLVKKKWK